jgi:hypothetical protein
MEEMVTLRNNRNGIESRLPAKLWRDKKNLPEWRGVFTVINTIKEPPEVVALKAKKAAQKPAQ